MSHWLWVGVVVGVIVVSICLQYWVNSCICKFPFEQTRTNLSQIWLLLNLQIWPKSPFLWRKLIDCLPHYCNVFNPISWFFPSRFIFQDINVGVSFYTGEFACAWVNPKLHSQGFVLAKVHLPDRPKSNYRWSMTVIAKQSQGTEQNQEIQVDKTVPQIMSSAQTFKYLET